MKIAVDEMPIVKKDIYETLDGTEKNLVSRVGDGSIIKRFEKTPLPKKPKDVVCPSFSRTLNGPTDAIFDCAWCYLQGTYRFHPEWKNGKPNIKDFEKIENHVEAFLNDGSKPEILNTGELSDSLVSENGKTSFSRFIIPLFDSQKKHKILFLTKGISVKNILDLDMPDQVVLSWTLNAIPVSKRWEKKAPKVEQRIKAAKTCHDKGYEVRIRIDPMVPIENWEMHYKELIDKVFQNFRPERITIGSLRGLTTTINNCKDRSWVPFMTESSGWGKKIDLETRFDMYSTIINYLQEKYGYSNVALCKETLVIWKELELDYTKCKCNCVL